MTIRLFQRGNRLNGDNCDPTCHYFNSMSTLSGVPGSRSFADGTSKVARFHGPTGITSDGQRFFITDANSSTLRQYRLGSTTTLAGVSFRKQSVDGVGSDAGFASPGDVVYLGGVLYIVDVPGTSSAKLRRLELDGGVVSTVDAGTPLPGLRGVGAAGSSLLLVDNNGLSLWNPAAGTPQLVMPANRLTAAAGANCEDVSAFPGSTDEFYLACNRSIVRVTSMDAGVSRFAGSSTISSCSDAAGGTLADARFSRARSLDWAMVGGTPRLYISDSSCHTVRQVVSGQLTTLAGAAGMPGYVNVNSTNLTDARFDTPVGIEVLDTVASSPSVHVADFDNGAYRVINPANTLTNAGSPPATGFTFGDGGTPSRYVQVNKLAVDGVQGVLYAYSFANNRLFQVSLDTGVPQDLMQLPGTFQAQGLAVIQGTLYVALSNKTVARFTRGPPATLETFAGQAGSTSPSADGDLTTAILLASDMTTDGEDLFFLDLSAKTVRKIDLQSNLVTTIVGGASTSTFPDGGVQVIVDGTGANARFANPLDLTSDGTSLYLLDGVGLQTPRTVVRKVNIATREVTTLAGDVFSQSDARDGVGPAARFSGAVGLATDGRVLFITDPGGGYSGSDLSSPTIRMLELSTLEVTTMVGTRGQWTIENGSGIGAEVNFPGPISFDPVRKSIFFYDFEEGVFQRIR